MNNKEIFAKIDYILINSDKPSIEIKQFISDKKFEDEPFVYLKNLKNIKQNEVHHPEGNVLNHTLLVIDKASEYRTLSKNKRVFMWAALLHDLGKLTITKERKGKITSYSHDIEGSILARKFLYKLTEDEDFINDVCTLVKLHMQPLFYDKKLSFFNEQEIIDKSDVEEIALLSLADRLGRGNLSLEKIKNEEDKINNFKNYLLGKKK